MNLAKEILNGFRTRVGKGLVKSVVVNTIDLIKIQDLN